VVKKTKPAAHASAIIVLTYSHLNFFT